MEKKKKNNPILSTDDPRFRSFLMSVLRKASRFWKPSDVCIDKSRVVRGNHICNICKGNFKRKDMKKDHIDPVVPVTGFNNWDDIIKRLFVGEDGWQAICVTCHEKKTKEENDARKALKKEKAVLKYFKKRIEGEN